MKRINRPRWAKWTLGAVGALVMATAAVAAGLYTNGVTRVLPNTPASQVANTWLVPVDTNVAGGSPPQTVAVTPFQLTGIVAEVAANTTTSTAAAGTLNTVAGTITTESLSTAAGATYTFTLTNSLIATTTNLQVAMYSKTNTGGTVTVTSITPAAGSAVIVFTNTGATALNGTMMIVFHV